MSALCSESDTGSSFVREYRLGLGIYVEFHEGKKVLEMFELWPRNSD